MDLDDMDLDDKDKLTWIVSPANAVSNDYLSWRRAAPRLTRKSISRLRFIFLLYKTLHFWDYAVCDNRQRANSCQLGDTIRAIALGRHPSLERFRRWSLLAKGRQKFPDSTAAHV
jgi:hypothetical protein